MDVDGYWYVDSVMTIHLFYMMIMINTFLKALSSVKGFSVSLSLSEHSAHLSYYDNLDAPFHEYNYFSQLFWYRFRI